MGGLPLPASDWLRPFACCCEGCLGVDVNDGALYVVAGFLAAGLLLGFSVWSFDEGRGHVFKQCQDFGKSKFEGKTLVCEVKL